MNFRQDEFAYRTDLSQIFGRDMRTTGILAAGAAGLLIASFATSVSLEARRAGALESQVAHLYSEAFPGQAAPSNPVTNMSQAVASVRDRADFLGVYGGDHSALDLLAELSRRIPEDLEVKFEEVNIDPRVIRIKVFAKDFEAPDRLTSVLSASPPFTSTKVAGEISSEQRREGITFSLNISLGASEEAT